MVAQACCWEELLVILPLLNDVSIFMHILASLKGAVLGQERLIFAEESNATNNVQSQIMWKTEHLWVFCLSLLGQ